MGRLPQAFECQSSKLYGYRVLENHLHLIASASQLPNVMKSLKMYTARQIIQLLERHKAELLLRSLRALKLSHRTRSWFGRKETIPSASATMK